MTSQHTPYFKTIILVLFLWLTGFILSVQATELEITLTKPIVAVELETLELESLTKPIVTVELETLTKLIVAVEQEITLIVSGAKGSVEWKTEESGGQIEGKGSTITYVAPDKAGKYIVTASAGNGEIGVVQVTVMTEDAEAIAVENANWEIFTNQRIIQALALSDDGKMLWVGTWGGLEQRNVKTERLVKVWTNLDGLPDNTINCLLSDGNGGLWVGTGDSSATNDNGGLVHIDNNYKLKVFNTNNSQLPHNSVRGLFRDNVSGLWIGTYGGLAHLSNNHEWTIFNIDNSGLPSNRVFEITNDGHGGLWIGTLGGGLAHMSKSQKWTVFHPQNSNLPGNWVNAVMNDGNGGVWMGTASVSISMATKEMGMIGRGLVHLSSGDEWTIFTEENSDLPSNLVNSLVLDGNGGLWIGTGGMSISFSKKQNVRATIEVGSGGISIDGGSVSITQGEEVKTMTVANGALAHLSNNGEWKIFDSQNSDLPNKHVTSLISNGSGGLWIGTSDFRISTPKNTNAITLTFTPIARGLTHLNSEGKWTVANTTTSLGLPYNDVTTLVSDNKDGLWLGTRWDGLVHFNNVGEWIVEKNSALQDKRVFGIASNNKGLWIGTGKGLAHRNNNDEWTIFNTDNSKLPDNQITTLVNDGNDGLWVGTYLGGLAHLNNNNEWTIFNSDNSDLPKNVTIRVIASDGSDGVWMATGSISIYKAEVVTIDHGLAHLNSKGELVMFDTNNSGLPDNKIMALVNDGHGGVWIGTLAHGLAHLSRSEEWKIFKSYNTGLPDNQVRFLVNDDSGGLWIGTREGGLAHLTQNEEWTVYDTTNSGLPDNYVRLIANNGKGGLWLWTGDKPNQELVHLTFGQQDSICANFLDDTECKRLKNGRRAAIIIHPNSGRQGNDYKHFATDFMAGYTYQALLARGYENDDIYFLSHKPDLDFNGDGQPDNVVDAPVTLLNVRNDGATPRDITVADIQAAFEWAQSKGKLDYPLIVVSLGHGIPNELLLNPKSTETLTAEELKGFLDGYQKTTDNDIIVIIEACHSGTMVPTLADSNRIIITSTDENLAYYDNDGYESFLKLYFDQLRQNVNFEKALQVVTERLKIYHSPRNGQRPQLNDSQNGEMARNLCLNGCFGSFPGEITLKPENLSSIIILPPGQQSFDFSFIINALKLGIRKVFASVITPEIANQRNEHGYSWQPTPEISLYPTESSLRKDIKGVRWQGHFSQFTTAGEYIITVKAKDHRGFITEAEPIKVIVKEGSKIIYPNFDFNTNTLYLPAVTEFHNGEAYIYQLELVLVNSEPITLKLVRAGFASKTNRARASYANFNPNTGIIYIPSVKIPNAKGSYDMFRANLQLIDSQPIQFQVDEKKMRKLADINE